MLLLGSGLSLLGSTLLEACAAGQAPKCRDSMTVYILFIYGNEKGASHVAIKRLDALDISRKHESGYY